MYDVQEVTIFYQKLGGNAVNYFQYLTPDNKIGFECVHQKIRSISWFLIMTFEIHTLSLIKQISFYINI